jgi:uncharacterized protein YdeI (YjbR/CyaY-like superfamily)
MTDPPKDPEVAEYLGRMRAWRDEFETLRLVLLRAGLDEEFKWRNPRPPARLAAALQRR